MTDYEEGEKRPSNPFKLVQMVYDHSQRGGLRSWQRLNWALREALDLAIRADMEFDADDFKEISRRFDIGYWGGANSNGNHSEGFYGTAVKWGNLSACLAFERWKGRKPFLLHDRRLAIGAWGQGFWVSSKGSGAFPFEGRAWVCSSFNDEKGHLVATLARQDEGEKARRLTLTQEMLRIANGKSKEHQALVVYPNVGDPCLLQWVEGDGPQWILRLRGTENGRLGCVYPSHTNRQGQQVYAWSASNLLQIGGAYPKIAGSTTDPGKARRDVARALVHRGIAYFAKGEAP